jgi:multidrug efflux pump subunit AcrA (membrane-fusion protein)
VTAEIEHERDVLWLPPQAIRSFNGRRFAVVQDGDVQRRVDVTLGVEAEERVEIEAGLEAGQIVVAP